MQTKPNTIAASIVTFVEALLLAMIGSGMLTMDTATAQLWVNVTAAGVALVTPIVGFWWASRHTTALADPKDIDNTPLIREDNKYTIPQTRRMIKRQEHVEESMRPPF